MSFVPFVTVADVRRAAPDLLVTLPDPVRSPGDPMVRPGIARLAGTPLLLLPLGPAAAAGSLTVRSPVAGVCRRVELGTAGLPGLPGVATLLEVSPLPFGIAAVLRRLPGIPVFYVALPGLGATPSNDDVVAAGEPLGTSSTVWVGALLTDRAVLTPAAVVDLLARAMTGADVAADIAAWQGLSALAEPARTVRVLDHAGRPGASYRMRVVSATGTTVVTADATGRIDLPAGGLEVTWVADDAGVAPSRPVHALYEASLADAADPSTTSLPDEPVVVPAAMTHGHLQVLDVDRWFAERPAELDPRLGVVHPGSRLQPLVDGLAVFRLMLDDLRAATGPGCGAHFAGWAFNDFPLDPRDSEGTMFTTLVRELRRGDPSSDAAGARFLMDKYIAFRDDAPAGSDLEVAAVLFFILGGDSLLVGHLFDLMPKDSRWVVALLVLGTVAIYLAGELASGTLLGKVEDAADKSKDLAAELNGIRANIALRARHPGRFADNPLTVPNPLPIDVEAYLPGVSSWHQKFQVIKRAPDPVEQAGVVGYVGGIDINQNRLDSPGHHGSAWRPPDEVALSPAPSPRMFHDVHARVTGPAAADVARTFERRWQFDTSLQPPREPNDPELLDVAFTAPLATDSSVRPQPARHLVQVCRSGYRPAAGGGSDALPWSPQGEGTIADAVIKAIGSAREHIYIEDQYFTPPDDYVGALLDASVREPSLRLLVVMPSASDQVFGDVRHKEMFDLLRTGRPGEQGYGDRLIIGAPVRRPVLGEAGRTASLGRLVLQEDLLANGDQILIGPRSRLPKVGVLSPFVPFWLWVEGERMLAVEQRDDVLSDSQVPSRRFLVMRANGPGHRWGAQPRLHEAGAAVTMAQVKGIYVHTKAIMVDDVFVGIGSCNTNRRGFFHDGEIQAFAVPEQLRAAPENPARALRTALWAEHLGLPPAMGPSLLADPVAAFDLFRRPTYLGNRLSSYEALGPRTDLAFLGETVAWAESVATLFGTVSTDVLPFAWNRLIEPTTAIDPHRVLGPEIGDV